MCLLQHLGPLGCAGTVSAKTGVGGFVFPGDHVDLMLTQTVPGRDGGHPLDQVVDLGGRAVGRHQAKHAPTEEHAGKTADQRLTESLGKISTEIDSVTRQLASGAIDNLAIKTRYLDYKYGGEDVTLPPPTKDIT